MEALKCPKIKNVVVNLFVAISVSVEVFKKNDVLFKKQGH